MELIAAIDLLGGRARRLVQGDYERPIETSEDPLGLARRWIGQGVRRLHVVDLDGAREGKPVNMELLHAICRLAEKLERGAAVQAGGGLRSQEAVEMAFAGGVDEVILGSAAIADDSFLARCLDRWPGRVGAALDLREGRVAVDGWREEVADAPLEVGARLLAAGASRLLITDVSRDGTGLGPNLELMSAFRQRFPSAVLVAAGGIASTGDLAALSGAGIDGAIVGRALLEGTLTVEAALGACGLEVVA
jgi:phosphoribosylformimino-5-aminoimidazole carboxamide ribotide isomerase